MNKLGFIILGILTAGFLLGMALQAEAQVPFTISGSFDVSPGAVTTGDFNNDGKLDLVVASLGIDKVSLLLGNGSGSFGAPTTFQVGTEPVDLAASDFDDDGNMDLAVANQGSGTVSILLGTGTGSFEAKKDYQVGSAPKSVAAGDLDNDTKLDLATVHYSPYDIESEYVSILLGLGDGSFGTATDFDAGPTPGWVEMGDLDGNDALDLIVANVLDTTVSILLGAGTGSFGSPTDFAAGDYPSSLAMGDVDGDGDLDIAIANDGTDHVTILLGNGDGSFADGVTSVTGEYPRSVLMSDFDRDGNLDLLVGRYFNAPSGSNAISVLLGDGTGSFGSPDTIFSLSTEGVVNLYTAIADFNGDQKPDVAVADTSANRVTILLNNPVRPMPWIPLLLLDD